MCLDVADRRGVDLRYRMRLGDHLGLSGNGGCCVGHFDRTVVVDRRATDDGVDTVAVVDCRLQWLEDHRRYAATEDGAVGVRVERPAMARLRHHRPRLISVTDAMRHLDRSCTRQSHLALAGQQALARLVNRGQRRRAGSLNRDAGPAEIELVGRPCRQIVLVVEQ